jgi:diguanylate cyclase (GGDEF)-like protein
LASDLLEHQDQRDELARLNLVAGQKAKASTAYQSALNYLNQGIKLLSANQWQRQYNLTLALHTEATITTYSYGKFDEMEQLIAVALQHVQSLIDQVKIYAIQIAAYIAQNRMLEAIKVGLHVLALMGFPLPENPTSDDAEMALHHLQALLQKTPPIALIQLPLMTAEQPLAAMQILRSITAAAYFAMPALYPLIVIQMLRLLIAYGNMSLSSFVYSSCGLILCGIVEDIEMGYALGQLALQVLSQLEGKQYQAKTLFMVNHFINHWRIHTRETLNGLRLAYSVGLDSGDLQFASYSGFAYVFHSYFLGRELTQLSQEMADYSELFNKYNQTTIFNYNQIYRQAVLNLVNEEEADHLYQLKGVAYDETQSLSVHQSANDGTALVHLFVHKLILCYLFQNFSEAVSNADQGRPYLNGTIGTITIPVFYLYDSLSRLALLSNSSHLSQDEILNHVATNQKRMKHWADHAPMNYLHKYYLVEAERCRILNQPLTAMELYDRAIALAHEHEYLNEAALAYELTAQFYLKLDRILIAKAYLQEAHYCYVKWGAIAKAKHLEKTYPQWLKIASGSRGQSLRTSSPRSSNRYSNEVLDLATVLKASQAISQDLVLDRLMANLLEIIAENVGAQSGFLIQERNKKLCIEANIYTDLTDQSSEQLTSDTPVIVNDSLLPITLINYVIRTQTSIVLEDATQARQFGQDPYILQRYPKSILCTPLVHQGKWIGIVYLENNAITGAFTQERLELVQMLCAQAAISLENARLYAAQEDYARTLEQKVAERTAALAKANEELHRLATLDGLTQVANRRCFDEYLLHEWKRSQREQQPLSLLLCDVDYFKRYNDYYGHQQGDECLKQVAHVLSNVAKRSVDLVARYGGEEFVIVLPNTDLEGASVVAETVRQSVQHLQIPHAQSDISPVISLSVGVACRIPTDAWSPQDLIARADRALYAAKQNGRNCVVTDSQFS